MNSCFMVTMLKRDVILKIYDMPNGLALIIPQKNQPNFQGCWGKMKKWSEKNFVEKYKQRSSKLKKGYSQDLVKQTQTVACVGLSRYP